MAILSSQYTGDIYITAGQAVKGSPTVTAAGQAVLGSPGVTQPTTTIAGIPPSSSLSQALTATPGPAGTPSSADTELPSYQFVAGWILLFVILTFVNKSRIGHVIIYYSLLLIILLILVTEYQQIVPILNSVQTIGMFNTKKAV